MNLEQLTPAPWYFDEDQGHIYSDEMVIATLYASQFNDGMANGRLIQATPDLLAICQRLVAWSEKQDGESVYLSDIIRDTRALMADLNLPDDDGDNSNPETENSL